LTALAARVANVSIGGDNLGDAVFGIDETGTWKLTRDRASSLEVVESESPDREIFEPFDSDALDAPLAISLAGELAPLDMPATSSMVLS
jgi:hypothetical protein